MIAHLSFPRCQLFCSDGLIALTLKKYIFPSVNILLEFWYLKFFLAVLVFSCPQPLFEAVGFCEIAAVIHLRSAHKEYCSLET